ncbi:ATP-binding protein [Actinoplanes sp. NPDC026670]|uniref:ATP-binding protein n=1 Tax=Actinoplanes sp. NPDC026670 TaxID=3154700 RepID=UPI00340BA962
MTPPGTPAAAGRIRPRERDAIVASLRAGMVPRLGQQHIQVGRADEVRAAVHDIERIADGGAGCRFVIGEYGSGKTFFLHLVRSIALEKRLVTVHADLSPDRRLHAASGQARGLYAELMSNLATKARPDGAALASVVERFVTGAVREAAETGTDPADAIQARLTSLTEMTGGYDFATVVGAYWRGYDSGDERLRAEAVRWLRGEFTSRVDARAALGVRTIVDDGSFYDHLRLMARFVRLAGFDGLLICLDEMVNLYKITAAAARNANYEQLLRIVNDTAQGGAAHLGFLFGGTPEFLLDTRRGLFSYPALASRLAPNRFAAPDRIDHSGPVIRLGNLTPEDVYVLLTRLRHVFAAGDPSRYLIPDDAITAYMRHCSARLGDAYFRTPRETIRGFLDLLALLEQHPELHWSALIGDVELTPADEDDELTSFQL